MPDTTKFVPLNELVVLRSDKIVGYKNPDIPYVGLEQIASGEPIILETIFSDGSVSTNSIFQIGDILFGKLRPNLRKSVQAKFNGYCSTDILVFRANSGVLSEFVAKHFQSDNVFEEAIRTAEGTKMPRTSWEKLKHLRIFVPSIQEQRCIAYILDTIDTQIQETERLVAKLKKVKAGLLHDLLTRGIDEHGNVRDPIRHPEQFKDSALGRIPREWEVTRIKDITLLGRGRVINQQELLAHPGVYPVYSSQSKDGGVFGYLDTFDFEGDYVTWTTDGAYAGTVFFRTGKFNCTNVCGTLKAKSTRLNMRYLAETLSLQTFKYVSYVGNPKLMNNVVAEIKVQCPPIAEQNKIASSLNSHDARIASEEAGLEKLRRVKRGLMHDLLTGRVRVNA